MPGRPPDLRLGRLRFDATSRAVVVAVVDAATAGASAPQLLEEGADAFEVVGSDDTTTLAAAVESLVGAHDVPVLVATRRAAIADACLAVGAAGCDVRGAPDDDARRCCEAADATVVIDAESARALAPSSTRAIVAAGLAELRAAPDDVGGGRSILYDARRDRAASAGAGQALAVALGARVLLVADARIGRRTADVMAAVLAARMVAR